ncbi:unnamed protein product [Allacma fusca]|uniref:Uncharacterized protein n=1 Tax=Allacma fusca TaxID=39272 RepID=A0A8J2KVP9_9HEXA|nr:unnamed protein product [Allacma fusca]
MFTTFAKKPHDDSLIDFCRDFVHRASVITHHPNHWAIQRAITALGIYLRNHRQTAMGLELSEWYVKCLRYLLSILDILTPGITYSRANVQLQLGWALQGQCEALKSQTKYDQAQRNSLEALALLRKSLKFFKHDFPTQ